MKKKINLTIDEHILTAAKNHALRNDISISELVEHYFKGLAKPVKRQSIINLIEELDKPQIRVGADLKRLFYQDQGKKYGF